MTSTTKTPGTCPFASLDGYVADRLFFEALPRNGRTIDDTRIVPRSN